MHMFVLAVQIFHTVPFLYSSLPLSSQSAYFVSFVIALENTSCNFDSGLCCWRQSNVDVFDWTLNSGSTWSSDTGPDYDHTSGSGKRCHVLPLILMCLKSSTFRST